MPCHVATFLQQVPGMQVFYYYCYCCCFFCCPLSLVKTTTCCRFFEGYLVQWVWQHCIARKKTVNFYHKNIWLFLVPVSKTTNNNITSADRFTLKTTFTNFFFGRKMEKITENLYFSTLPYEWWTDRQPGHAGLRTQVSSRWWSWFLVFNTQKLFNCCLVRRGKPAVNLNLLAKWLALM